METFSQFCRRVVVGNLQDVVSMSLSFQKVFCHNMLSVAANLDKEDAIPLSSWNISVRTSVQAGRYLEAITLYSRMFQQGIRPDNFVLAALLKASARLSSRNFGTSIHSQVCKLGYFSDVYAATALIDLYSRLDNAATACQIFQEMPIKNVVSWNSVLSAHLKAGDVKAARAFFDEMPVKDTVSWNSMVSGYAKAGDLRNALSLFEKIPQKNSASWNSLISGYVDHGDIKSARALFDRMPERNTVSWVTMISGFARIGDSVTARRLFDHIEELDIYIWNAMISCYAQNDQPKEALALFMKLCKLGILGNLVPDKMTFSSVIAACAQMGDLRYGQWVEEYMNNVGVKLDDHLRTALIDLYAKFGSLGRALDLFSSLSRPDLVSYSALILGCGLNCRITDAVTLFKRMLGDGIAPNAVTFMGLLTAYSHAGLVDEGLRCFHSMMEDHGVSPSADHYAIMVDLLGRVGQLDKAHMLIKNMPMQPQVGAWGALLLACRLHGNVELGELAARNCFELDPEASGYYVMLANIYTEAGRWSEAKRLRNVMLAKGFGLNPGQSWLELG